LSRRQRTIISSTCSTSCRSVVTCSQRVRRCSVSLPCFEEGTMKRLALIISILITAPSCALIDSIKSGRFCLFAGDVDPATYGAMDGISCPDNKDQRSVQLVPMLPGEQRIIPIVSLEVSGDLSDKALSWNVSTQNGSMAQTGVFLSFQKDA